MFAKSFNPWKSLTLNSDTEMMTVLLRHHLSGMHPAHVKRLVQCSLARLQLQTWLRLLPLELCLRQECHRDMTIWPCTAAPVQMTRVCSRTMSCSLSIVCVVRWVITIKFPANLACSPEWNTGSLENSAFSVSFPVSFPKANRRGIL